MKNLSSVNTDWLNPVLVKEVRQFFHNKLFLSLVGGLLGLQLLLLFIFNLTFDDWKNGSDAGKLFIGIDTVLMYVCVFGICAWGAMQRFCTERSSKELDFSNITLLTPFQIVAGKLASTLVIWVLVAALCLPFMTVAYFFRNVTPGEILLTFGIGIIPMLIVIQAALFCGALGKKWAQAIFIYFCFQLVPFLVGVAIASLFESKAKWEIFWFVQGGGAVMFLILFAATVELITPPFANRMFVLRLLLVILMIPVLAVMPWVKKFSQDVQMVICCFPLGIFGFLALLNCCDRDEPGGRVLARVPRNIIGRIFHYLLSSNRTGGVILGLLLLAVFGVTMAILGCFYSKTLIMIAFGVGAYALLYSELAIILHRAIPQIPGWVLFIIVFIMLGCMPMLLCLEKNTQAYDIFVSPFSLFNVQGEPRIFDYHFWIAPAAAFLAGVPFIAQMILTFKDYRAPEPGRENEIQGR